MNECQAIFNRLRTDFPIEYQLLHLESAAIPLVLPLVIPFIKTPKDSFCANSNKNSNKFRSNHFLRAGDLWIPNKLSMELI